MGDLRRQGVFEHEINEELRKLCTEFAPDSLAYLLLTSKCERELSGALASRLHIRFIDFPSVIVCREWESFDVALLLDGEPASLIEAKAAYTFDVMDKGEEPFPTKEVRKDIAKLQALEFEGNRYILVFFTQLHQIPQQRKFDAAIKYVKSIRRRGNRVEDFYEGFQRFHTAIGDLPIVTQGEINAGSAFDVEVGVLYWLFDAN